MTRATRHIKGHVFSLLLFYCVAIVAAVDPLLPSPLAWDTLLYVVYISTAISPPSPSALSASLCVDGVSLGGKAPKLRLERK